MSGFAGSRPFMNAPFDEENPILGDQAERPRSRSWGRYLPLFLVASVAIFALIAWLVVSRTSSGLAPQISQTKTHDLTPPRLISKPELERLHYCGFHPDQPESLPTIPPLLDKDYDLVLVQSFIRHGDRFFDTGNLCWAGQENITYECQISEISIPGTNMSDSSIPNPLRLYRKRFMTNRNDFEGDCMVGQLSEKGYHQEKALGSIFHKAYVGTLLKSNLNSDEVFFRSDDVPRTVMSAQAFISGMFPVGHDVKGVTPIIDIWTMDFDRETEISNAHECPGLTAHFSKAAQSEDYQKHIQGFTTILRERLSPVIGVPAANITDTQFDCAFVSSCRGSPLPEGLTMDLIRDLERDALFKFYYPLQYPNRIEGTRLAAGPLIREIFERMNQVIDARLGMTKLGVAIPYVKFSLYSGHDTGPIMLLLSAFAIEDKLWAPYASYITMELYQNKLNHEYAVRLVYNGKVVRFLGRPDSDTIPFSSFREIVLPIIPR